MTAKKYFYFTIILLVSSSIQVFSQSTNAKVDPLEKEKTKPFTEVFKDFPRVEKNLRKWDAPVVADLDRDGYPDLLINDHGYGVRVCWNNKGIFSKPYDVLIGDVHGISVGDFDGDGNLEIIMARGGGSGSNARNSKIFRVDKQRNFSELPDFNIPLELMRGRTVKFFDGDNDGKLDLLNFAFPSAEKNGKSENYIYKNDGKGQLVLTSELPPIRTDGQKALLTDFNGDGIFDILLYGEGKVKAYQGKGDLTFQDVTNKILPYDIENVTDIVELDYDNDGDFDLFFTRGKSFEIGETFFDPGSNIWGFYTKRGKFRFEDLEVGDVLNMENFQSQWPDNDAYYIGESGYKYEFIGETYSGKDIRLVNSSALGFPDIINEKRGFNIGYVGNGKWRIAGDLNAPSTGIVLGVNAYPESKHAKGLTDILLENKNGKFTDVTKQANLYFEDNTTGVAVADLDNNGFQDILITRRGDLIHKNESIVYLNQGKSGFRKLSFPNIISPELGAIGMGIETIDYNNDGKVDVVIGNERGKWHLFKNTMKEAEKNNFIVVEVGNSPSGKCTGLGALVKVEDFRNKQVQRVGSTGANYSLSFNNFIHFGLGECRDAINVKVTWTNGETMVKSIANLNGKVLFGKKM